MCINNRADVLHKGVLSLRLFHRCENNVIFSIVRKQLQSSFSRKSERITNTKLSEFIFIYYVYLFFLDTFACYHLTTSMKIILFACPSFSDEFVAEPLTPAAQPSHPATLERPCYVRLPKPSLPPLPL